MPAIIGGSNLWRIDWFSATLTRFTRKFMDVRVREKLTVPMGQYKRNNQFLSNYYAYIIAVLPCK